MNKIFEILGIKSLTKFFGKKALYVAIVMLLEGFRVAFPSIPLPSTDLVFDLTLTLIGAHTFTDVIHLVSVFISEWHKTKVPA